ncbi:hypothetical protein SNN83_003854 [Cronobacter malonaticus]|nr:hypothetical protein [Cronobacter malonaticus]
MTESAGRPQKKKKWKSRTFVADASAREKLLKTISNGIFHQQQKNRIFDLERFPEEALYG